LKTLDPVLDASSVAGEKRVSLELFFSQYRGVGHWGAPGLMFKEEAKAGLMPTVHRSISAVGQALITVLGKASSALDQQLDNTGDAGQAQQQSSQQQVQEESHPLAAALVKMATLIGPVIAAVLQGGDTEQQKEREAKLKTFKAHMNSYGKGIIARYAPEPDKEAEWLVEEWPACANGVVKGVTALKQLLDYLERQQQDNIVCSYMGQLLSKEELEEVQQQRQQHRQQKGEQKQQEQQRQQEQERQQMQRQQKQKQQQKKKQQEEEQQQKKQQQKKHQQEEQQQKKQQQEEQQQKKQQQKKQQQQRQQQQGMPGNGGAERKGWRKKGPAEAHPLTPMEKGACTQLVAVWVLQASCCLVQALVVWMVSHTPNAAVILGDKNKGVFGGTSIDPAHSDNVSFSRVAVKGAPRGEPAKVVQHSVDVFELAQQAAVDAALPYMKKAELALAALREQSGVPLRRHLWVPWLWLQAAGLTLDPAYQEAIAAEVKWEEAKKQLAAGKEELEEVKKEAENVEGGDRVGRKEMEVQELSRVQSSLRMSNRQRKNALGRVHWGGRSKWVHASWKLSKQDPAKKEGEDEEIRQVIIKDWHERGLLHQVEYSPGWLASGGSSSSSSGAAVDAVLASKLHIDGAAWEPVGGEDVLAIIAGNATQEVRGPGSFTWFPF
jgi:hypothetical protein